ncbi:MAG: sulfotransferase family 2 domain-containing protein [Pirellulaceae bacterium]|nr:sulfotransferase family 2 domain-containing protein [Pirellulaceae bacterium]
MQQLLQRFLDTLSRQATKREVGRIAAYLKQELQIDHIPPSVISRFLASDVGRTAPLRLVRERTQLTKALYGCLTGRDARGTKSLLPLILSSSEELPTPILAQDPTIRSRLRQMLESMTADFPPGQRLLFDHVSKTGGSTITVALNYLFPFHCVSNRLDLLTTVDPSRQEWAEWARWPILSGHVGQIHHHFIPDIEQRQICTLIRDPVSRTRSVYTWLRFNIKPANPAYHEPTIKAARELGFSEFIRCKQVQYRFRDKQFEVLSGNLKMADNCSAAESARATLAAYDLVGVTDQLTDFFDALLVLLRVSIAPPTEELINRAYRNKSLNSVTVSPKDEAYLRALNPIDSQLYQLAKSKVEARTHQARSAA